MLPNQALQKRKKGDWCDRPIIKIMQHNTKNICLCIYAGCCPWPLSSNQTLSRRLFGAQKCVSLCGSWLLAKQSVERRVTMCQDMRTALLPTQPPGRPWCCRHHIVLCARTRGNKGATLTNLARVAVSGQFSTSSHPPVSLCAGGLVPKGVQHFDSGGPGYACARPHCQLDGPVPWVEVWGPGAYGFAHAGQDPAETKEVHTGLCPHRRHKGELGELSSFPCPCGCAGPTLALHAIPARQWVADIVIVLGRIPSAAALPKGVPAVYNHTSSHGFLLKARELGKRGWCCVE